MPRLLPMDQIDDPVLLDALQWAETRLGFIPNSLKTLAIRPEICATFMELASTILENGTVDQLLKNMVAQVSSRAAGCDYCIAHTAVTGRRLGMTTQFETALTNYQTSPLITGAQRAALRVARSAAVVPGEVTDEEFEDLKQYFNTEQIVEITAVISLFGFFSRWAQLIDPSLEIPTAMYASNSRDSGALQPVNAY